jgi:hypothetical protein
VVHHGAADAEADYRRRGGTDGQAGTEFKSEFEAEIGGRGTRNREESGSGEQSQCGVEKTHSFDEQLQKECEDFIAGVVREFAQRLENFAGRQRKTIRPNVRRFI